MTQLPSSRSAIRIKPGDADVHVDLGNGFLMQGNLDAGIDELKNAIRIDPRHAEAHAILGIALHRQGKLDQAIEQLRTVLIFQPNLAEAHGELGEVLREQGKLDEAIYQIRAAIQIKPDVAEAHCMLGWALQPSARYWNDAFDAQPALADDLAAANRYNAACAAASAGTGKGEDQPPLNDAARARWRKKALEWLRADLAERAKQAATNQRAARIDVSQELWYWKADRDLAGVRDAAALKKLPADEQQAFRALWSEFDAILARLSRNRPAS